MDKIVTNVVARFKKSVEELHEQDQSGQGQQAAVEKLREEGDTGDKALSSISRPTPQAGMQEQAVAPPGWENTVKKMKKHDEIDNPWALAWYMKNKGAEPHHANEDKFVLAANAAFKRFQKQAQKRG